MDGQRSRQIPWYLVLALTMLPALASAQIYRWTDANGQVHFSQHAPASAEPIEVRPQVVERDSQTREREAHSQRISSAREDEQRQAQEQAQTQQATRNRQCQEAYAHRDRLARGGKFYRESPQGERHFYQDTEVDAARQQLDAFIARQCQ